MDIFRERHGEAPTNAPEPYKAGGVVRAAGKNPKIRIFPKYPRFPPPVRFFGSLGCFRCVFGHKLLRKPSTRGEKPARRGSGRLPCTPPYRTPPLQHQAGRKRSESGPTPPRPSGSHFWSSPLGFRSSNQLKRVRSGVFVNIIAPNTAQAA